KAVGPGVWNGWKSQLIRTLYYETEPVLTGGFSEVNRAQRVAVAQVEFGSELKDWTGAELDAYVALQYPAYWPKVDPPQKVALDTIAVSREFDRDEDEARRATRIANSIEQALRGDLKLPEVVAKRAAAKGRLKAFAIEPTVMINNQWSNRYTMVEVTGLDRPG